MRETRPVWRQRYERLIAGIEKNLAREVPVVLSGQALSGGDLIEPLHEVLDAARDTDAKHAAWLGAVKKERGLHPKVRPLELAVALADYGLAPRGPRAPRPRPPPPRRPARPAKPGTRWARSSARRSRARHEKEGTGAHSLVASGPT